MVHNSKSILLTTAVSLSVALISFTGMHSGSLLSSYSRINVTVDASSLGSQLNEDFIGSNWLNPGPDVPLMNALGVQTSRIAAGFDGKTNGSPNYDCSTSAWNSSSLDSMVAAGELAGAQPEIIILATPPCMVLNPGTNPAKTLPPDPSYTTAWENLVTEMAVHEIETNHVTVYEIWNEPDWFEFWNGTMAQFFQLYSETSSALEKAASETSTKIMIGGPALANVSGSMDTVWLDAFLSYVSTNNLPLGFFSWHLYADDPFGGPSPSSGPICLFPSDEGLPPNPCYYKQDLQSGIFGNEAQSVQQELTNFPTLHPQLWIDEWNVDALYDPRMSTDYDASYALSAMQSSQDNGVSRMVYYDMSDGANSPPPNGNFGLIDGTGNPKPVYYAFQYWHDMAGSILSSQVNQGGDPFTTGGVGVISTENPTGVVHVALYDFVPYDPSGEYGLNTPTKSNVDVSVSIANLPYANYNITFERIGPDPTDVADPVGSYSSGVANFAVGLPEEGVVMAVLTPVGNQLRVAPNTSVIRNALGAQTGKNFNLDLLGLLMLLVAATLIVVGLKKSKISESAKF